jgi:hypothetical protein
VFRPADRIAYGATADYITKSASATEDYFEDLSAPLSVLETAGDPDWPEHKVAMLKLAHALAVLEETNDPAFRLTSNQGFPVEKLAKYGSLEAGQQLSALAQRGIILHYADFCKWAGSPEEGSARGLYSKLVSQGAIADVIEKQADLLADIVPVSQLMLASAYQSQFSLEQIPATVRTSPRDLTTVKLAGYSPVVTTGMRKYASYQLQALRWSVQNGLPLGWLARCVVGSNES